MAGGRSKTARQCGEERNGIQDRIESTMRVGAKISGSRKIEQELLIKRTKKEPRAVRLDPALCEDERVGAACVVAQSSSPLHRLQE